MKQKPFESLWKWYSVKRDDFEFECDLMLPPFLTAN